MPDEISHVRGWFLKAESDFITAERGVESGGPYGTACFHAQQAVEKYLKGLLALHSQAFHQTHNRSQGGSAIGGAGLNTAYDSEHICSEK
jgi:HEPN domain-containing protein